MENVMCDDERAGRIRKSEMYQKSRGLLADTQTTGAAPVNDHTIYQLKQQREYHFKKLCEIQIAIDAVNKVNF